MGDDPPWSPTPSARADKSQQTPKYTKSTEWNHLTILISSHNFPSIFLLRNKKMWLIVLGVMIHLIFFSSIFDIYFTSPIVHGMAPQPMPDGAPAKRLCLLVADGLRADKFFDINSEGKHRMPFLRTVACGLGSCGVSNTRVPTESRPGHVAMIAGFYEDVSAVTKGWKENPVEFDSVFNQSRFTWAWGSPDIIPIFTKIKSADSGEITQIPHIFPKTYPANLEDFAAASPEDLDLWVFDQFTEFLENASRNRTLKEMLNQDKIVFFLHLLGMDTTGHTFKPQSRVYDKNMAIIDKKIQETVDKLNNFFGNDGRTAFLFTSDHGMTDWGSHGSGHEEETATPLVAWGAGIAHQDGLESVSPHRNKDVEQAELTPLMASLIGISIPVNNVAMVPLHYLNGSQFYILSAFFANAKQIHEQLMVKMNLVKSQTFDLLFQPFRKSTEESWRKATEEIENILRQTEINTDALTKRIAFQIKVGIEGLLYYQTYDRIFLSFVVAFGYFGWITYIIFILISPERNSVSPVKRIVWKSFFIFGLVVLTCAIFAAQGSPKMYILYTLLPVLTWGMVFLRFDDLDFLRRYKIIHTVGVCFGIATGTELLLLCFFYRPTVSVGLLFSGAWLVCSSRSAIFARFLFAATSVFLSVFPLLPIVGQSKQTLLVLLTGAIGLILPYIFNLEERHLERRRMPFQVIQNFFLILAMIIVGITAIAVNNGVSPGMIVHTISWLILGMSFFMPLFGPILLHQRFITISSHLLSSYLLMSISYESLFLLFLIVHMYLWIILESATSLHNIPLNQISTQNFNLLERSSVFRSMNLSDTRRAFFFIFFILAAFFGTGNIASVNSFDPTSVFSFVTVFKPHLMGAILICKVMIPFLIVGCAFHLVHVVCRLPMKSLFLTVMLISDLMALYFFFLVKTEGSWLDIGTSISHYVLVMALIVFTSVLQFVSSTLMTTTLSLRLTVSIPRF